MTSILFIPLRAPLRFLFSCNRSLSNPALFPQKRSMSQVPRRSARLTRPKGSGSADSAGNTSLSVQHAGEKAEAFLERKQENENSSRIQKSDECVPKAEPEEKGKGRGKRPRRTPPESTNSNAKTEGRKKRMKQTDSTVASIEKAGSVVAPKMIYPEDHKSRSYKIPSGILRIVTWNVASFRTVVKSGAFRSYLDKERPHILCLQETKMSEEAMSGVSEIEGYNMHWNHSRAKKGYSGVAVFINKSIRSLKLELERVTEGIGDDVADAEGRVLTLYFNNRLVIVNSYVPNSGGKLMRLDYRTNTFEPKMRSYLNQTAENWNVVYCGDLNVAHEEIDIHDSKGNKKSAGHTPEERKEFGQFLESGEGWVDCWRKLYKDYPGYTYYSRRFGTRLKEAGKGWRLDYHVVNSKLFELGVVSDCFVRPDVEGSDHYPLILDYRVCNDSNES